MNGYTPRVSTQRLCPGELKAPRLSTGRGTRSRYARVTELAAHLRAQLCGLPPWTPSHRARILLRCPPLYWRRLSRAHQRSSRSEERPRLVRADAPLMPSRAPQGPQRLTPLYVELRRRNLLFCFRISPREGDDHLCEGIPRELAALRYPHCAGSYCCGAHACRNRIPHLSESCSSPVTVTGVVDPSRHV